MEVAVHVVKVHHLKVRLLVVELLKQLPPPTTTTTKQVIVRLQRLYTTKTTSKHNNHHQIQHVHPGPYALDWEEAEAEVGVRVAVVFPPVAMVEVEEPTKDLLLLPVFDVL